MLNEGFQSAFLAVVVLAGIGMALALLLPGRPRKRRRSTRSGPGGQCHHHAARGGGS